MIGGLVVALILVGGFGATVTADIGTAHDLGPWFAAAFVAVWAFIYNRVERRHRDR